ncbi:diphthamide biosynthesis enzyme Dph2 [Candidatus Bathyarchaeota archaeon RBG_16_48_13]|nr:MAG: diphthamide biosynthesis enzyme Dph2 [Candidatus Bathyarchaeota archaeon RBG_16_48_13]
MFELEEEKLLRKLTKIGPRLILIQLPEGLKKEGFTLAQLIEGRTNIDVAVSADPCYGGCDVAIDEALLLGAELVVHYGHTPFLSKTEIPVIYMRAKSRVNVAKIVRKSIPTLSPYNVIGLVATAQNASKLKEVKRILEDAGKIVRIGKKSGLAKMDGQILGCDYSTARSIVKSVDAFLFVGGGDFHPLGLAMRTRKKVVVADPYRNRIIDMESLARIALNQRWMAIEEARKAKRFGIIIALKLGQKKISDANKIREKLKRSGRNSVLLAAREVIPESLLNFQDIEAFVITACPRIAIDDSQRFLKPVLNQEEFSIMIGERPWEDYTEKW